MVSLIYWVTAWVREKWEMAANNKRNLTVTHAAFTPTELARDTAERADELNRYMEEASREHTANRNRYLMERAERDRQARHTSNPEPVVFRDNVVNLRHYPGGGVEAVRLEAQRRVLMNYEQRPEPKPLEEVQEVKQVTVGARRVRVRVQEA